MSLLTNTQAILDLQEQIAALPEQQDQPIPQPILEDVTITPSETEQRVTAGVDADGIGTATVKAIPSNYVGSAVPKQGAATIDPTESEQTAVTAGKYTTADVKVAAIPSNFVGSAVAKKASADLTASGATVTAPAGYYSAAASKSVASGTAGTPSATKGSVSNHSISITPTVTNTTGYITGGTKSGNAVTVTASELVSGSETKTQNGTYDVTNLSQLVVNVATGGGLPAGISAVDFGTYTLASAVSGTSTFTVPHNLGVVPDFFLFWSPSNIATTYSELAVMRSTQFGWRSTSYLNKTWYHGNSTTTVTGADSSTSYGIKTMTASNVTICPHTNQSYSWRAATYNYIAIKFG